MYFLHLTRGISRVRRQVSEGNSDVLALGIQDSKPRKRTWLATFKLVSFKHKFSGRSFKIGAKCT